MQQVLVTGASGFIGSSLVSQLEKLDIPIRIVSRHPITGVRTKDCIKLDNATDDWSKILKNINVVIHLAGRAHVIGKYSKNARDLFHQVNVEGTRKLAQSAIKAGVSRFIFVSSIGVLGEVSKYPVNEASPFNPVSDYAISKMEAEKILIEISEKTDMSIVIVRPPLVYGPKNPGNMLRLLKLVKSGIPLPFASIRNQRSFIGVDNLCDFLVNCITHPKASNEAFVVADHEIISTPELIKLIAVAMHQRPRLWSCKVELLYALTKVLGQSKAFQTLSSNLVVDASKAKRILTWNQKISLYSGIKATVDAYLATEK